MAGAPAPSPTASPAPSTKTALPWEDKQKFRRQFTHQAIKSYIFLSFGIGLIAFLLPIALPLAGGYDGHYTISYFYHVGDLSRNILVGGLCATGVFLFLFHGLSRLENWLLNLAGAAVIGVAMVPMPNNQGNDRLTLHASFAMLFFGCIAIVAILLSKGRIKYIIYPPIKRRFQVAYTAAGAAMVLMPAAVIALHMVGGRADLDHRIYWAEAFGIWAFAAYWFVKTQEYRLLLGLR